MITTIKGDITTAKSGLILHCVNCKGVMGSGVAKAIRDKWPRVFPPYQAECARTSNPWSLLGRVVTVEVEPGLKVMHCFGQVDYGRYGMHARYDAIDHCMRTIADKMRDDNALIDAHFPLFASDRAGGHWPVVREIIEHRLPDQYFNKHLWLLPE